MQMSKHYTYTDIYTLIESIHVNNTHTHTTDIIYICMCLHLAFIKFQRRFCHYFNLAFENSLLASFSIEWVSVCKYLMRIFLKRQL